MSVMTKFASIQDTVSKMSRSNVWIAPDYETLYYHFRCHFCHTQMGISPSGLHLRSEIVTKFCHSHRHEIHPEPVITAKATPRATLPPPAKVAIPTPVPVGRKFREEEWS